MIPVLLTKIKTKDGITLDGIYVPPKKKSDTALIWVHGLTSRFYSGQKLIKELSVLASNIGYFKFNTRGHDIINRDGGKKLLGGGLEKFTDCILDIKTVIKFSKSLGYKKIILAGSSTGANKSLFYIYKTRDRNIKGLILLSPVSDIAYDYEKFGKNKIKGRVKFAKGQPSSRLLPQKFGIWSAQRFISILEEKKPEDVFPYYDPQRKWKELKSVNIPLFVIFGSQDEFLTKPAKEIIKVFEKNSSGTKKFTGIVLKGANHGFNKKEKELSKEVVNWIKKIK